MALRKQRPSPKSIAAKKFLLEYLSRGPAPASEVQEAAQKRGINRHTLIEVSPGLVTKKPEVGLDGIRRSYWSLCASPPYGGDTPAVARKNSAAFRSGYEHALADLLDRVNNICDQIGNKKAREFGVIVRSVVNDLKWGLK